MRSKRLRRGVRLCTLTALSVVALVACLALAAGALARGGNSVGAKLCQRGGWQELMDSNGSQFSGPGQCVSYAAHGGAIYGLAAIEVELCVNQPADGICVESNGFGLEPTTLMTTTLTKNDAFLEFHAVFVLADGTASDSFGHIEAPCVPGNLYAATATGTSAPSLNTAEPGIPITSNTVTRTSSCP